MAARVKRSVRQQERGATASMRVLGPVPGSSVAHFLVLGWEHVRIDPGNTAVTPLDFYDYPLTHSLVTTVGWAATFDVIYYVFCRYSRGALVLAAGVTSHWVLDLVVHRPDLPLAPGVDFHVGLGLWNSVPGTIIVEFGILAVGVAIYSRLNASLGSDWATWLMVFARVPSHHLAGKYLRSSPAQRDRYRRGGSSAVVDRFLGLLNRSPSPRLGLIGPTVLHIFC